MRQGCSDSHEHDHVHRRNTRHWHPAWHVGEGARTALALVALGALLAKSWSCCAAVHRRRLAERAEAKPQALQRWEGEGGQNEPPVGGGMTE